MVTPNNTTTPSDVNTLNSGLLLCTTLILPCSYAYYCITSFNEHTKYTASVAAISNFIPSLKYLIIFWSIIEFLFYFYFLYTRKRLQQTTKPAKPLNQIERASLFWNCVQTINNIEEWSEGWFYYKEDYTHPKFKEIQRENLALWFAWAFWHEHLDIVRQTPAWSNEIEWMLSSAEEWFSIQFPSGLNSNLQCIRLNLDPVQAYHRPLLLYVGLYVITFLFNHLALQWIWGFHHGGSTPAGIVWGGALSNIHDGFEYIKSNLVFSPDHQQQPQKKSSFGPKKISYYYRNTEQQREKVPLVFLHGIGAGLVCYAEFIHQLTKLDQPIFLVELPYVAMHMVDQVPTTKETVSDIKNMLKRFGYDKAIYVSHSLGTGVSSWVMNMAPETVAGLVMIDPICFLLHYHNVAFNFVHRIPKTPFEYVLHYGASRELYISNYISRHFQWFETIYFSQPSNSSQSLIVPSPLDMQGPLANATVFLSEKDGIVGSSAVYDYLVERGVDARIMEGLEHAMFLSSSKWKKTISQQISAIARKAEHVK